MLQAAVPPFALSTMHSARYPRAKLVTIAVQGWEKLSSKLHLDQRMKSITQEWDVCKSLQG